MWFWRRFFSFSVLTVLFGLGLGLRLEPLWTRTWLGLEPLWTWTWLGLEPLWTWTCLGLDKGGLDYSPSIYTYYILSQRTHTSLSLSLFSARQPQRGAALSVKHRYYVALHANTAGITAQLLSLSYVYLILSDDGSIIRIFVQINILERRAGYVVLMGQSLLHIHSVVW